MICKVCGYEDNQNFSVCPYCGEATSSQNQTSFINQKQYDQTNSYNSSQYETPFTKPNPQSNQYEPENQYNNYQNQPYRPVARYHKNYSANMPNYFKEGFGCSFEITQNELRMSRNLHGGDFVFWVIILLVSSIFLVGFFPVFIPFLGPLISNFMPFFVLILFIFIVFSSLYLTNAKIKVNSSGITVKTVLKEYFIPREKIDSLTCRTVTRSKGKYGRESFYDVFIIMKDRSIANKIDLDTGLCYKNKTHVDYLIDVFNEHLGFM